MSWREAVQVYLQPRVVGMLFLGFAAGLPFLLVFSTLSAWLTETGLTRTTIGFFSWIGITYSIKVFWAPVVDRVPLPLLDRWLGRRRSWMLLAQSGIILGLLGMAGTPPTDNLALIGLFALLVAFSSATQDVALDAYRIESIDKEYQGAMAAMYIGGYRLGLLVSGAGAFYLAEFWSWPLAYLCENSAHLPEIWRKFASWFIGAVVCPFTDFFQRNGTQALIILLFISVFRISDITMGVMANPFYLDMGFSKIEIANIAKFFGFFMTIAGAALGGILVVRFGIMRPLLLGAVMVASTNLLFAILAGMEPNLAMLALVISADNLSAGLATSAFIAYLSSLTNSAQGYVFFFTYAAVTGIPAIFLVLYLMKRELKTVR